MTGNASAAAGTPYVYIDPHVMCTPAIADIDGDGHDELVLSVSYFFDRRVTGGLEYLRGGRVTRQRVPTGVGTSCIHMKW